MEFAERCEIGATLNADLYAQDADHADTHAQHYIKHVTILKKYPYFAMTDHGCVTWANLAIHNPQQLRRDLLR